MLLSFFFLYIGFAFLSEIDVSDEKICCETLNP